MRDVDITVQICGNAGEGTIAAGEILNQTLSSLGFHVIAFDTYPSEIRGFGRCVAHSRIRSREVLSQGNLADILVALNDEHSIPLLQDLRYEGVVLFDDKPLTYVEEDHSIAGFIEPGFIPYGVPLRELAEEATGSARGKNMVALGAISALFDVDPEAFEETIGRRFAKKSERVQKDNILSFQIGYTYTRDRIVKVDRYSFGRVGAARPHRRLMNGNQAVARAAIDVGCRFYAGYPITPATKIMEILAKELPKAGGSVLQTEDEISAIGAVVGASFSGARAMTATSGPGLSLMVEFISYAVMTETPAVIVNSQRGGPSTGMPTNTEQSDLNLAIFGGSGDSPRIVLAPTSVEECYSLTADAFYLAEKFQVPVILLIDFFLSSRVENVSLPPIAPEKLQANLPPEADGKPYARYLLTESGISPRSIPGEPDGYHTITGLEHDELARVAGDAQTHGRMSEKRHRKILRALEELPRAERFGAPGRVDVGVLGWGSTLGAIIEAVEYANERGVRAAGLKVVSLSPLDVGAIEAFFSSCRVVLVPELNYSGQFANLLGMHVPHPLERMPVATGHPIPFPVILNKILELAGQAEGVTA